VITNTGRNILAKYLLGQTSSYASHIAIGIGPEPLAIGESFPDFSTKESLDFEVLRMPIVSRGFVYDEDGFPNIVLAAEIPSDQRYEITEVGVYPGRVNPAAGSRTGRTLYTFGENENWEFHEESSASTIETIVSPLNLDQASGSIAVSNIVFRTNSNNTLFGGPLRVNRNERPRYLNRTLMLKSNMSWLQRNFTTGQLEVRPDASAYYGSHIHYNGISLDLDPNSLEDELRLAFSIIDENETSGVLVDKIFILIEFANSDVAAPTNYARLEVEINESDEGINFGNNRYFVVKKKLSELVKSPGFTWSGVNTVKIYSTIFEQGLAIPSEAFFLSLDGLRIENTTIKSPLYGLVGYSVIKTDNGNPIVKEANTSNTIEFRFGMDVL
jgi:hypothetical protein